MPYNIEIASKDCQFGTTCYEFNLVDSEGILPNVRTSYKIRKENVSEEELNDIKNTILLKETENGLASAQLEADKAFMRQFVPLVDGSLESLKQQLLNYVTANYQLSEAQQKIAQNVVFSWKLKE